MKILLTGSLGFIGYQFTHQVPHLIDKCTPNTRWYPKMVGVDKAVYSYNLNHMPATHKFYFGDIADKHIMRRILEVEKPDILVGMAAESFVDNSITNIDPFLHTNIVGTQVLIDLCLEFNIRYFHISTDEVYGQKMSKNDAGWIETDPLQPRNPYAASKACAEHIVIAAHNTHGLQYQMSRACNIFGKHQKDENLIPHIFKCLFQDKEITIHGDGSNWRQYCFVEDKVDAIMTIINKGEMNTVYNIGDDNFFTNLEMVEYIAALINKTPKIKFIPDRKAHDKGYKVDTSKIEKLGWKPSISFRSNLMSIVPHYERRFRPRPDKRYEFKESI